MCCPASPGIVGADHVAVLLAEAPHQQDEMMLVVDVGTNAEMSLGNRQQVLCASSPTGPAFEGAQITHGQRAAPGAIERVRIDPADAGAAVPGHRPGRLDRAGDDGRRCLTAARATGICGSGIIEAVAEMFLAGIIAADGRFDEDGRQRSPRVRIPGPYRRVRAGGRQRRRRRAQPIVVTQSDVRAIQLAKAALYAGVKLLMAHRGVDHVDRIALAGAFGSYIEPAACHGPRHDPGLRSGARVRPSAMPPATAPASPC